MGHTHMGRGRGRESGHTEVVGLIGVVHIEQEAGAEQESEVGEVPSTPLFKQLGFKFF
jgi:hypothetical protein